MSPPQGSVSGSAPSVTPSTGPRVPSPARPDPGAADRQSAPAGCAMPVVGADVLFPWRRSWTRPEAAPTGIVPSVGPGASAGAGADAGGASARASASAESAASAGVATGTPSAPVGRAHGAVPPRRCHDRRGASPSPRRGHSHRPHAARFAPHRQPDDRSARSAWAFRRRATAASAVGPRRLDDTARLWRTRSRCCPDRQHGPATASQPGARRRGGRRPDHPTTHELRWRSRQPARAGPHLRWSRFVRAAGAVPDAARTAPADRACRSGGRPGVPRDRSVRRWGQCGTAGHWSTGHWSAGRPRRRTPAAARGRNGSCRAAAFGMVRIGRARRRRGARAGAEASLPLVRTTALPRPTMRSRARPS